VSGCAVAGEFSEASDSLAPSPLETENQVEQLPVAEDVQLFNRVVMNVNRSRSRRRSSIAGRLFAS
jgi:hypothetical protein